MIPKCYNRADFGNYLLQDGWDDDGRSGRGMFCSRQCANTYNQGGRRGA